MAGPVRRLQPDLWLRLVALSALAQSIGLRLTGRYRWVFHAWPAAIVLLMPLAIRAYGSISLPFTITALAGAVVVTRAALSRNTTYTHVPAPATGNG